MFKVLNEVWIWAIHPSIDDINRFTYEITTCIFYFRFDFRFPELSNDLGLRFFICGWILLNPGKYWILMQSVIVRTLIHLNRVKKYWPDHVIKNVIDQVYSLLFRKDSSGNMDILVLVCIGEGEVACSPMTIIQQQPNIRKKKLTCNVEIRLAISFSFNSKSFKNGTNENGTVSSKNSRNAEINSRICSACNLV